MKIFVYNCYSFNHILEDHERYESLPLGVDNISNYVEISSWSETFFSLLINLVSKLLSFSVWIASQLQILTGKELL